MLVTPVTVGLIFKDKLTNLSPLQVVWRLPQDNGLLIDWMEVNIEHCFFLTTLLYNCIVINCKLMLFQVQWQPMRRGEETWVPSGNKKETVERRRGSVSVVIR